MRYLLLTLALVLAIGCGTATPTSPDLTDVYKDYPRIADVVDFNVVSDITGIEIAELDISLVARSAQEQMPPGWVPDGSLMNDNELLIYFSAHIAESILGSMEHEQFCNLYDYLYQCFWEANDNSFPPFTYTRFMVWLMESNLWDVPDERDIFPPCA